MIKLYNKVLNEYNTNNKLIDRWMYIWLLLLDNFELGSIDINTIHTHKAYSNYIKTIIKDFNISGFKSGVYSDLKKVNDKTITNKDMFKGISKFMNDSILFKTMTKYAIVKTFEDNNNNDSHILDEHMIITKDYIDNFKADLAQTSSVESASLIEELNDITFIGNQSISTIEKSLYNRILLATNNYPGINIYTKKK